MSPCGVILDLVDHTQKVVCNFNVQLNCLTLFFPMFPIGPPKSIRKLKVFLCFQGDQKGKSGKSVKIKHAKQQTFQQSRLLIARDGSRNRAKSKKKLFATIANGS